MPKPIKIAFDASPMIINKTGVAYYIERIMYQLALAYPDDVELVGFYYNFLGRRKGASEFPRLKNLRYHGVHVLPSKVVYQLRRWGIEVPVEFLSGVHADFNFFPNILDYPSVFSTPSSAVVHDLTYVDLPQYVSAKLRGDLRRFVPRAIRRSTFTTTVSAFTQDRLEHVYHVPPSNVLITPIPPAEPVLLSEKAAQVVLRKLSLTKPFILFVGTVEPRKNLGNLVAAYRLLPAELRQKYSLVIAGRLGWYYEETVAAIEKARADGLDVIHLGYVDDEARGALYQSASLFAHASSYEGFGMPVLEAMSYGLPCAVSDIDVFREVAADSAVFFDQNQPADIAAKFATLLGNESERTKLGKKGKAFADKMSWAKTAELLYERIVTAVEAHNQAQKP